jgi:hypothetical protein
LSDWIKKHPRRRTPLGVDRGGATWMSVVAPSFPGVLDLKKKKKCVLGEVLLGN